MTRTKKTDDERKAAFLEHLSRTAHVSNSAEAAKLPRPTLYHWRKNDPEFRKAWDEAVELGTCALEDEAVRRGYEGTERPVYQGGQMVGTVRDYSDTLLIFMLKARRPHVYRDQSTVEHTGPDGGPLQVKFYVPTNGRNPLHVSGSN